MSDAAAASGPRAPGDARCSRVSERQGGLENLIRRPTGAQTRVARATDQYTSSEALRHACRWDGERPRPSPDLEQSSFQVAPKPHRGAGREFVTVVVQPSLLGPKPP